MIRRPPRSTQSRSSAASDVYKRQARTGGGYGYLAEDGRTGSLQSFAELLDDALSMAGGLHDAGLRPGETIALIVPEARDFLTTFLGAVCAGLVPAPLYPPVRLDQFETYLRQTTPAVRVSRAAGVVWRR